MRSKIGYTNIGRYDERNIYNITSSKQLKLLINDELDNIRSDQNLDEGVMDWIQTSLDVVGLIPGVGEVADAINAIISLGRGNPIEALLSLISMIPTAGDIIGKGGKVIYKLFKPALALFKGGAKTGKIINKIGAQNIKKAWPMIEPVKNLIVQHGPQMVDLLKHIKAKDITGIEKIIGKKVPKVALGAVEKVLENVANKLPGADIQSVLKFLAEIDIGDKLFGGGDDTGELEQALEATFHNGPLLLGQALYGDKYVNEQLMYYADEIERVLKS